MTNNQQQSLSNTALSKKLKQATAVWLFLIILTLSAWYISEQGSLTPALIVVVLASLIIKAQLITDYFMGLHKVKLGWRLSMTGFAIVISGIVWGLQ